MEVGIIFPQNELSGDPEAVRKFCLRAEEHGYGHLLIYDHVLGAEHAGREPKLTGPYTENDPFHDPFVMMSHIAALTKRIEMITGVLILPQRQTALVARQAADVDLFSGGRLKLGIGTGWNYVEYDALGQDYETRGKRQEEQIGLLRQLWTEPMVNFDGRFDKMDRVTLNPRPRRSIPILLGGYSNVALRRAARIGDGFIFAERLGRPTKLFERLKNMLEEEGRNLEGFVCHLNVELGCPVEDIVEKAEGWRELGGTHFSVTTMGRDYAALDDHLRHMDGAAEVLSKAGLLPAS